MKLTEYKNEEALELVADVIEPVTKIFTDEAVKKVAENGNNLKLVKTIIKKHSKDVIEILARLDGVEPKEYNANIPQMFSKLMEIVTDKELMSFFTLPQQTIS